MSTAGPLRLLLDHMEWADAVTWDAVRATAGAAEDPRLRKLLHHVHEAQRAFLAVWRAEPLALRGLESFDSLADIERWGREGHRGAAAFMATNPDPGREVTIPWRVYFEKRFGAAFPASLADTVLQVTAHSSYHRGQINARIRELGGEPPLVDYIVWVWAGRPAAVWTDPSETSQP